MFWRLHTKQQHNSFGITFISRPFIKSFSSACTSLACALGSSCSKMAEKFASTSRQVFFSEFCFFSSRETITSRIFSCRCVRPQHKPRRITNMSVKWKKQQHCDKQKKVNSNSKETQTPQTTKQKRNPNDKKGRRTHPERAVLQQQETQYQQRCSNERRTSIAGGKRKADSRRRTISIEAQKKDCSRRAQNTVAPRTTRPPAQPACARISCKSHLSGCHLTNCNGERNDVKYYQQKYPICFHLRLAL